jgi:uncharacterized protein
MKYPWTFFSLALGWTALLWLVPVAANWSIWEMPGSLFLYIGGAGVPLSALILARRDGVLLRLSRLIVDPRFISAQMWAAILLFFPMLHFTASLISWGAGASATPLPQAGEALAMPLSTLVTFMLFLLFLGPLPEEIGWRGYALPALLRRFSPALATLILAVAWCAWHVPLFFMSDYYAPFGGPPEPGRFFLNILIISFFYTAIFFRTGGSVLAAVLFHFMGNISGELLALTPTADTAKTLLLGLGALLLLLLSPDFKRGPSGLYSARSDHRQT